MSAALPFSGPIFERVDEVLRDAPGYRDFRAGRASRAEFADFLESRRSAIVAHGVPPNDVHFAKRFPASADDAVRQAFASLAPLGLAWPEGFEARAAQAQDLIGGRFDHQGLHTYIYPEEARLLLAIALAARPRRTLFLGSYYGYWAAWALAALAPQGGSAVLLDPDPHVIEVARANLARLYPGAAVQAVCATGEDYLAGQPTGPHGYDLVVLDAELPRDHPDPARRGKGVYAHLLRAALPHLAPRALLVCHNILFQDHSGCSFFDEVIARNQEELGPFMAEVATRHAHFIELPTTEGVGVGILR